MVGCYKCGAGDWEVVSEVGSLEVMKCKRCGAEETVHTHVFERPLMEELARDDWFELSIDLPKSISAHQIEILRHDFRKLELMSPTAIKRLALTGQQPVDLGQYPASEIARFNLEQTVESIGLTLNKRPVPSPVQLPKAR